MPFAIRMPRIVTKHFFRTLVGALAACFFAYLPALITCADSLLQGHLAGHAEWWTSFADSLEPAFGGGIAVSVAGCLTYFENEAEVPLGRIAGIFATMSFIGSLLLLVGFFLVHNPANDARRLIARGDDLACATAIALATVTAFSFLTIVQVRRARDHHMMIGIPNVG